MPGDSVLELNWSARTANDPKHRPQRLDRPSSTVRKAWSSSPQEAFIYSPERDAYRKLSPAEVAVIQGFPPDWTAVPGLKESEQIAALGNAVPPALASAILTQVNRVWEWRTPTVLDLCAGVGGLALGAHNAANLESVGLIDNWSVALAVLQQRKPWKSEVVMDEDLTSFDLHSFNGRVGLLLAGVPCQPWSRAGVNRGEADQRDLLGKFPEMVAACQPEVFLVENVPGLLANQHRSYVDHLIDP